jgi:hypothetical protein
MAITVGGVMANLALRHKIGKPVRAVPGVRGNRVRVTRKERIQLSKLLSETHRNGKTRRTKAITADVRTDMGDALSAGPTEDTMRLAKETSGSFFQRIAFDSRVPTDVRMEAFARMAKAGDVAEDG